MNNKIDMNQLMELAVKHQAMQQPQQVKSGITYCELLSVVLVTLKCNITIFISFSSVLKFLISVTLSKLDDNIKKGPCTRQEPPLIYNSHYSQKSSLYYNLFNNSSL